MFLPRYYKDWSHGGGRVVSASGSETSVSSSTPTSAIIYDAYTSILKKNLKSQVIVKIVIKLRCRILECYSLGNFWQKYSSF